MCVRVVQGCEAESFSPCQKPMALQCQPFRWRDGWQVLTYCYSLMLQRSFLHTSPEGHFKVSVSITRKCVWWCVFKFFPPHPCKKQFKWVVSHFLKNFWRWIIPWQCGQWGHILAADGPKCLTTLVSQLANTLVMEIRSRPWVKGKTQHLTLLCLHCISSFSDVLCIPGVISAMKSCNLLIWGTHPHSLTPGPSVSVYADGFLHFPECLSSTHRVYSRLKARCRDVCAQN